MHRTSQGILQNVIAHILDSLNLHRRKGKSQGYSRTSLKSVPTFLPNSCRGRTRARVVSSLQGQVKVLSFDNIFFILYKLTILLYYYILISLYIYMFICLYNYIIIGTITCDD